MTERDLSLGERRILKIIQAQYGVLNQPGAVKYSAEDEAVLWIKDTDGSRVILVNLTNLADWLEDDFIKDESELLAKGRRAAGGRQ